MDWNEAMEEAKEELRYGDGYIEDWSEVVEGAKDIISYKNEEEYNDFCEDAKDNHQEYLRSIWWKELRARRMKYDKFLCKDCGKGATEVHHKRYVNMKTPWEFYELLSLCKECHKKRHGIK